LRHREKLKLIKRMSVKTKNGGGRGGSLGKKERGNKGKARKKPEIGRASQKRKEPSEAWWGYEHFGEGHGPARSRASSAEKKGHQILKTEKKKADAGAARAFQVALVKLDVNGQIFWGGEKRRENGVAQFGV